MPRATEFSWSMLLCTAALHIEHCASPIVGNSINSAITNNMKPYFFMVFPTDGAEEYRKDL